MNVTRTLLFFTFPLILHSCGGSNVVSESNRDAPFDSVNTNEDVETPMLSTTETVDVSEFDSEVALNARDVKGSDKDNDTSDVVATSSEEMNIAHASFLWIFENNHAGMKINLEADAFCISVLGKDVRSEFLARFRDFRVPVVSLSECPPEYSIKFENSQQLLIDDETVQSFVGYFFTNQNRGKWVLELNKIDGEWVVEKSKKEKLR